MESDPHSLSADDLRDARAAAQSFLDAVLRGDEADARSHLIVREGESMDFATMHGSMAGYSMGEPASEGDVAVMTAKIQAAPGTSAPPVLPLVVSRSEGAWRVDMSASMQRLLGGIDLAGMVKQMAEGIGTAMSQALEGVAESLGSLGTPSDAATDSPSPPAPEED